MSIDLKQLLKSKAVHLGTSHIEVTPTSATTHIFSTLIYMYLANTELGVLERDLGLLPDHFAGHSFRIGVATVAAQVELEDSLIITLGQWNSAAYLQYI